MSIFTVSAKIVFHGRESELYRIVVGRVWGKKLDVHPTWNNGVKLESISELNCLGSLLLNKLEYGWMFMDMAIIHNYDQVWGWERLHLCQKPFYELIEKLGAKWAFYNITMQNAIIEQ